MQSRKVPLTAMLELMTDFEVIGPIHKGVAHITNDSLKVKENGLFVAILGAHLDGHNFVEEAIARGATVVVMQRKIDLPKEITAIVVQDSRKALADLACAFYGRPADKLTILGVTGTNGKTSVCYYCQAILNASGQVAARLGTTGHDLGRRVLPARNTTPDSVTLQEMFSELVHSGVQAAVMEVSSHSLVQHRVRGIRFQAGVFTNLSQDHLDFHENLESYLEAKRTLFTGLTEEAVAILNADDPASRRISEGLRCNVRWYSRMGAHADLTVRDVRTTLRGSTFTLVTPMGEKDICLHVAGDFTISNFLAGAAAALSLGCPLDGIAEGAARVTSIPGRAEMIEAGGRRILVDYAHTPAALEALLSWARLQTSQRVIIVFGAGGNRDSGKRAIMGHVAAKYADVTIITNDNPRGESPTDIANQILSGIAECDRGRVHVILDRKEAIEHAIGLSSPEDAVLVAGKGHERAQLLNRQEIPFDDREVIKEILLHGPRTH